MSIDPSGTVRPQIHNQCRQVLAVDAGEEDEKEEDFDDRVKKFKKKKIFSWKLIKFQNS